MYLCYLTQRGSPFRGPTMAIKRGCWSRANRALIRDCMPVRLPNWEDGYLQGQTKCLVTTLKWYSFLDKIFIRNMIINSDELYIVQCLKRCGWPICLQDRQGSHTLTTGSLVCLTDLKDQEQDLELIKKEILSCSNCNLHVVNLMKRTAGLHAQNSCSSLVMLSWVNGNKSLQPCSKNCWKSSKRSAGWYISMLMPILLDHIFNNCK